MKNIAYVFVVLTVFSLILIGYPHVNKQHISKLHVNKYNNLRLIWKPLYELYKQHAPVPSRLKVTRKVSSKYISGNTPVHLMGDEYMYMSPHHVNRMRKIHDSLLKSISAYPTDFFEGHGVVMVAGGRYLKTGFVSIRMLRRVNPTIPVELWMADDTEFDEPFCKGELAELGVTCMVISEVLDNSVLNNVRGLSIIKKKKKFYQTKALAILFSSFEKVLFLDADNFPLYDPEFLLFNNIFNDTGVVVWPDFWRSSVSAHFYSILGMNQTHHWNNTVESGQILWNKKTQWKSLVVAVYYNIFGRKYFYPLLSLGAPGQGDKETFTAAVRSLYRNYYIVKHMVSPIGHYDEDGIYQGVAMLQADISSKYKPLFVHANGFKFNNEIFSKIKKSFPSGNVKRIWPSSLNNDAGYDVEYAIFQELMYTACDSQLRELYFCQEVSDHISRVFIEISPGPLLKDAEISY